MHMLLYSLIIVYIKYFYSRFNNKNSIHLFSMNLLSHVQNNCKIYFFISNDSPSIASLICHLLKITVKCTLYTIVEIKNIKFRLPFTMCMHLNIIWNACNNMCKFFWHKVHQYINGSRSSRSMITTCPYLNLFVHFNMLLVYCRKRKSIYFTAFCVLTNIALKSSSIRSFDSRIWRL